MHTHKILIEFITSSVKEWTVFNARLFSRPKAVSLKKKSMASQGFEIRSVTIRLSLFFTVFKHKWIDFKIYLIDITLLNCFFTCKWHLHNCIFESGHELQCSLQLLNIVLTKVLSLKMIF